MRLNSIKILLASLISLIIALSQPVAREIKPSYDLQNTIQVAQTLLKDRRYQEAVSLLKNRLAIQPQYEPRLPLLLLLTDGLLSLGDIAGAQKAIDEASNLASLPEENEALSKRKAMLTVMSFQLPATDVQLGTETQQIAPSEPPQPLSTLVSNSFFETDIRQVLTDLSMATEIPILWDATVQGLVTYEAKDQPLQTVLKAILFPAGYTYTYEDGTVYVGSVKPEDPAFGMLSKTVVVSLSNLEANEAIAMLSDYFKPFVKATNTTNMVCITAPATLLNRIQEDLKSLDAPPDQILIEVIVTEIATDALREMGLDWSVMDSAADWLGNLTVDNTAIASPGLSANYSRIGVDVGAYTVDLMASLEALVQSGKATIRANPRITTLNGRRAEISLTKDQYFIIQTGTSQAYQYNTLQAVSYGIRLEITPYASDRGEITVFLKPQVGDVVGAGANNLPEISTRSANTSVRVMNGQTFTIGGLSLQQEKNVQKKIPFLGDIPILGYVFRYDRKEVKDTEIVIFVTPHILVG